MHQVCALRESADDPRIFEGIIFVHTVPSLIGFKFADVWQPAAGCDALDHATLRSLLHLWLRQRRYLCVLQVKDQQGFGNSGIFASAGERSLLTAPLSAPSTAVSLLPQGKISTWLWGQWYLCVRW